VARFAVMGAESVAYHQDNVMDRADDHPGRALDYYGSRGETPLRWGGAGAARLGLYGEVTAEAYAAAFAEGGFTDPLTGRRLVNVKRPGVEIVVDLHKSVALLGVIGQADDMHAILDAETAATMGHLEALVLERGGQRGVARRRTPTSGLTYAVTRHGTSRSGDPHPHDHALVPSIVEMQDTKGGWKALDTAAVRDWVEPATMVGRLHSAAEAVRRGYAIEPDPGTSGRKRSWRIVGIPAEACDLYSKRHDEIDEYMATQAHDTPQARAIAARATRKEKRYTGVDELMPRWHAELAAIGWPVDRLAAALDDARRHHTGLAPPLTRDEIDRLAVDLFDVRGEFLRRRKVFTRSRLIAEVAPRLYGHDPAELDGVIDRIVANREVVPLVGIDGAREQAYTTATVLATEARIAAAVERLAEEPFPVVDDGAVAAAIARKETQIARRLTPGQAAAVAAVAGSGRRADVVVGVAGAGKTTALDAATSVLEDAGHRVIGTSTSSTATKTLRDEAGVEANTIRRLLWRLDHGHLTLNDRTVVILDEAAMTADADLLRLIAGVERAGAKLVLVGDHRQLAAIGPGGALQAVIERHPDIAVPLAENVRQHDPAERGALAQLRHGSVPDAVDWYAANNRTLVAPTRLETLVAMVDTWAADVDAGHDTLMLAFLRRDVDDLNRLARDHRRRTGHLHGPDLEAPGGRHYAIGDRVVLTAPNNPKDLANAERAGVAAIDLDRHALTLTTDTGRTVTLAGAEIDDDHLAHGYAITVHRSQGTTVDRAHLFADGGGRQLGYVAMSRARQRATVHAVADDPAHALEDLETDWSTDRSQQWLTTRTTIGADPRPLPSEPAVWAARLRAELAELDQAAPPDIARALGAARTELARLRSDRGALEAGSGRWSDTPPGRAARRYQDTRAQRRQAERVIADGAVGRRERRRWEKAAQRLADTEGLARDDWLTLVEPVADRLDRTIARTETEIASLESAGRFRHRWLAERPEHARRVEHVRRELVRIDDPERARLLDRLNETQMHPHEPAGPDLGLGL
jgi:conjugative relaxase-like TrwC/TraI family protein